MSSLNHSYVCLQLLKQLIANETTVAMPRLSLDVSNEFVSGIDLTPDISVFHKSQIKPNAFNDDLCVQEKPVLVIEVVSSSETIQEMLDNAVQLITSGVKTVWTVEPYSRSVFVNTPQGEQLYHEEWLETDGIKLDLSKVFPNSTAI